ncbi:unnamed protein product [Schistocephalus solidus]|uniref:Epididymal-specific lipocalin-8 n=2 Tax=Schistocephalus solidus TaxID=70667 RepID=A0A183SAV2_SCHSO|nr:unnamed protein product [Schistocephalus solidus]
MFLLLCDTATRASAPQWVPQRSLCGFWYMVEGFGSSVGPPAFSMRFLVYGLQPMFLLLRDTAKRGSAPQWVPQRSLCGFWYMDSSGSAPQWVPQRSLCGFWYMDSRDGSAPQWVPQRSLSGFWYMDSRECSAPQWVPQHSLCGFWYMDSRE